MGGVLVDQVKTVRSFCDDVGRSDLPDPAQNREEGSILSCGCRRNRGWNISGWPFPGYTSGWIEITGVLLRNGNRLRHERLIDRWTGLRSLRRGVHRLFIGRGAGGRRKIRQIGSPKRLGSRNTLPVRIEGRRGLLPVGWPGGGCIQLGNR